MANTKKMTKRDYFNILRASYPETASNYADVIGFIDHELELLAKKNASDKKPTAQQIANDAIKEAILEWMEDGKLYTITDLIKTVPACADLTNQRVNALLKQMYDCAEPSIVRSVDKRKAYFSKVITE